jgi:hypothetical protein
MAKGKNIHLQQFSIIHLVKENDPHCYAFPVISCRPRQNIFAVISWPSPSRQTLPPRAPGRARSALCPGSQRFFFLPLAITIPGRSFTICNFDMHYVLDYLLLNCNLVVFIALLNCNSLSRLAQPLGLPLFPLSIYNPHVILIILEKLSPLAFSNTVSVD